MNFFKFFIIISFFISINAFSQKVIKHKVSKGESIYGIASKYKVTQKEIYDLNPKVKGATLQLNQVVSIPNKNYKEKEKAPKTDTKEVAKTSRELEETDTNLNNNFITHLVAAKETLYSLSKKYGVTMETICEMNPQLKTGNLKTGTKLRLPNYNNIVSVDNSNAFNDNASVDNKRVEIDNIVSNVDVIHTVLPKETLYGISKKFGVTVAELYKLNSGVENGLPVGYDLIIKKGTSISETSNYEKTNTKPTEVFEKKSVSTENLSKSDILVEKATEHIGTRYRRGGTTDAGFDCSGFMFATYKNIDLTLPRTSQEMAQYGTRIEKEQAQKGDLIFFATFGGKRVSHVGMVTEVNDDEIKFIHSSSSNGVMISSTKERYYSRTFVQINRVIQE